MWGEQAAPPDLAARLARLPARVEDPVLRRLQRDLLLAPGPLSGAGDDAVRARVDRLVAMGEPAAAVDLLDTLPDKGAAFGPLRATALLAADRVDEACGLADQAGGEDPGWAEVLLVCAALRGDRAKADLLLGLAAEQGTVPDPLLGRLVRALGGTERVPLKEPPPADPLLLPLLRRVPLEPQPKVLAAAPLSVRQAVAQNPNVPAGLAPPAAEPPAPPSLPGLDGNAPADWPAALKTVPEPLRGRWLAVLDGLGLAPPDPVLLDFPPAARAVGGGRVDLAAWRDLERDAGRDPRGLALLDLLTLLDGRPADAAPLALRAAVAALRGLGLEADARAVAAAGLAGRAAG